ncbi:MAG TPA: cytochrome c oxidase subunit 3 [Vicinamibacterales bacterium]|nr:cytochrome c oxidase subunit 3 [Vicinamibacterales bacterium]
MSAHRTLDVSGLAPGAFGHRSIVWWGTAGIIVIELMAFAMTIGAYFYLRTRVTHWPPNVPPPDHFWGALNTIVLLVSAIPNELARRAGDRVQLGKVRLWVTVALAFGLAFNVIRIYEFMHLNVRWDTNAYGSVVWLLLGLHTTHIVTDFFDTTVLAAVFFIGPVEEKRFIDVSENAGYWYFVVLSWLPIYGVIYWAPRLI